MQYGDLVKATYTPTDLDPHPPTREGVVVCTDLGDDLTQVYFGTLEDYSVYLNEGYFQEAADFTGVFYPHELTR